MATYKSMHERRSDGAQKITMQLKPDEGQSSWFVQHDLPGAKWSSLMMSHRHDCKLNVYGTYGTTKVGFF